MFKMSASDTNTGAQRCIGQLHDQSALLQAAPGRNISENFQNTDLPVRRGRRWKRDAEGAETETRVRNWEGVSPSPAD